jgi:hypothetical protein
MRPEPHTAVHLADPILPDRSSLASPPCCPPMGWIGGAGRWAAVWAVAGDVAIWTGLFISHRSRYRSSGFGDHDCLARQDDSDPAVLFSQSWFAGVALVGGGEAIFGHRFLDDSLLGSISGRRRRPSRSLTNSLRASLRSIVPDVAMLMLLLCLCAVPTVRHGAFNLVARLHAVARPRRW